MNFICKHQDFTTLSLFVFRILLPGLVFLFSGLDQQEKPTNCGTTAANVLDELFGRQTLMRIKSTEYFGAFATVTTMTSQRP